MPTKQRHRGRHPEDDELFAEKWVTILRSAVVDLSYLRTRGYAEKNAIKIVGDRYQLDRRQRRAVLAAACSDASLVRRTHHQVPVVALRGHRMTVDGYNLLITIESIVSGAVLIRGRDGAIRDLASLHGSYRRVEETSVAIRLAGQTLQDLGVEWVTWLFDAPVSNSRRLKRFLELEAEANDWPWRVEVADRVDQVLAGSGDIVVSSDGWILGRCWEWCNLTETILGRVSSTYRLIDLRDQEIT